MKTVRITVRLYVLAGLVLIIGALAMLAAPATARAASGAATVVKFNGPSAVAEFDTVSNGVETFVLVVGSTPAAASPQVVVVVNQFDVNTGTPLLLASGSTSSATIQVGPNLSSATVSAAVPLTDSVSGTSFTVGLNVAWTANSPLMHEHPTTTVTHTPNITSIFHSNSSFRNADASGTVSDGTTNFTPAPSVFAQILRVNSAQITITRT